MLLKRASIGILLAAFTHASTSMELVQVLLFFTGSTYHYTLPCRTRKKSTKVRRAGYVVSAAQPGANLDPGQPKTDAPRASYPEVTASKPASGIEPDSPAYETGAAPLPLCWQALRGGATRPLLLYRRPTDQSRKPCEQSLFGSVTSLSLSGNTRQSSGFPAHGMSVRHGPSRRFACRYPRALGHDSLDIDPCAWSLPR